jgi:hypothetical protein
MGGAIGARDDSVLTAREAIVIFDLNQYDEMAHGEADAAKQLADDRPDVAQVHASLAIAYATLAQTAATLAASH